MAITYKVLGQTAPTTTANVNLLTVGAGKSAAISTINMSNHTASAATYRIFVRIGGAAAGTANDVSYDIALPAKAKIAETIGVTLAATDVVTVQCDPANSITFTAFGQENS
jgi:hypothetical protein